MVAGSPLLAADSSMSVTFHHVIKNYAQGRQIFPGAQPESIYKVLNHNCPQEFVLGLYMVPTYMPF